MQANDEIRSRLEDLAEALKAANDIGIFGHVNPDGDAAGSCIALKLALQALGKRAFAALPGGLPQRYAFLPNGNEVWDSDAPLPFRPKCAISVDVASKERLGGAVAAFDQSDLRLVLDHHASNPGFGDLCCIDGARAACGELVLPLIDFLGVSLNSDMADNLFTAISTDSGNFNFENTSGDTLRAAAACVDAGANVGRLTEILYRTRRVPRTLLLGRSLGTMALEEHGRFALARLTRQMYEETGACREDADGIVNFLIESEGVEIAALAEELSDGRTKFSLRSKAPHNVATDIAMPLGGGGHDRAAGVTLELPLEAAIERVRELALRALQER